MAHNRQALEPSSVYLPPIDASRALRKGWIKSRAAVPSDDALAVAVLVLFRNDLSSLIGELHRIRDTLTDGDILFAIKKHIAHFELHERIESRLLSEAERLAEMRPPTALIGACRRGNQELRDIVTLLVAALVGQIRPLIERNVERLVTFEESFFAQKVESLYPAILSRLGAASLTYLRGVASAVDPRAYQPLEIR